MKRNFNLNQIGYNKRHYNLIYFNHKTKLDFSRLLNYYNLLHYKITSNSLYKKILKVLSNRNSLIIINSLIRF